MDGARGAGGIPRVPPRERTGNVGRHERRDARQPGRRMTATMDSISRRLAYAKQRWGDTPQTTARVMNTISEGTEDALLTPAQRKRVKHHRAGQGAHRRAQRKRLRRRLERLSVQRAPDDPPEPAEPQAAGLDTTEGQNREAQAEAERWARRKFPRIGAG